jgi:hypothetical protein
MSKFSDNDGWFILGIGTLIVLAIIFSLVVFGLSVWAIVFGIMDIVNVGWNGWAVAWIVIGSFGVLSAIGGGSSARTH